MPNYYYDTEKRKSYNRRQKVRSLVLALLILLLLAGVGVAVYIWKTSGSSGPVVIKPPTKSYYAGAPLRVFTSDRFTFKSTDNWSKSQEESLGSSKYVYFTHSINNNLIELELDIIFDRSLDGQAVNFIMPVKVKNNQLSTSSMSQRCGDAIVAKNPAPPVKMQLSYGGTAFICAVAGSAEKAAAGLVGGSYDITLNDSRGRPVIVNFAMVNNSSAAFESSFKQVLESFRLK